MSRRMELANDSKANDIAFGAAACHSTSQRTWAPTDSWSACFVVTSLTLVAFAGCSGSDLSGYRPLDKVSQSTNAETPSDAVKTINSNAINDTVNAVAVTESDSIFEQQPVSALVPLNIVDGGSISALLKVVPSEASNSVDPSTVDRTTKPTTVAAEPRKVEILIREKTFRPDSASKALRVSYDDLDLLKVINMEPVTTDAVDQMPQWLKGLSGQRIKIRGFMYPTYEPDGIERFVLARDNQICCFGRDPKIYDLVQIDMRAGKTTNYIPATRSFDVVGRFKIEMVAEDGKPYGLYFLEDAEVIDR